MGRRSAVDLMRPRSLSGPPLDDVALGVESLLLGVFASEHLAWMWRAATADFDVCVETHPWRRAPPRGNRRKAVKLLMSPKLDFPG